MVNIYSNLLNVFIWFLIFACLFQCCCRFRRHRQMRMAAAQQTTTSTTTTTIPAPSTPEDAADAADVRTKVLNAMFPEQKIENDSTLIYDAESNGYLWTNNNTGDASCSICLENFEPGDTIVSSSCNHAYHRDCLMGWLSLKDECPNCRQDMWEPAAYEMLEQEVRAMNARTV